MPNDDATSAKFDEFVSELLKEQPLQVFSNNQSQEVVDVGDLTTHHGVEHEKILTFTPDLGVTGKSYY